MKLYAAFSEYQTVYPTTIRSTGPAARSAARGKFEYTDDELRSHGICIGEWDTWLMTPNVKIDTQVKWIWGWRADKEKKPILTTKKEERTMEKNKTPSPEDYTGGGVDPAKPGTDQTVTQELTDPLPGTMCHEWGEFRMSFACLRDTIIELLREDGQTVLKALATILLPPEGDHQTSQHLEPVDKVGKVSVSVLDRVEAVRGLMEQRTALLRDINGMNFHNRKASERLEEYKYQIQTIDELLLILLNDSPTNEGGKDDA